MPGATDTLFFERAGMNDTKVGADQNKDHPADVAKTGFEAMMNGEVAVVHGFKNKVQAAVAHVLPDQTLANMHARYGGAARHPLPPPPPRHPLAEPGLGPARLRSIPPQRSRWV